MFVSITHIVHVDAVDQRERACLISRFLSGESFGGNWVSKVRMRSPLRVGSWGRGIPSPGTTLLYLGLQHTGTQSVSMLPACSSSALVRFMRWGPCLIQVLLTALCRWWECWHICHLVSPRRQRTPSGPGKRNKHHHVRCSAAIGVKSHRLIEAFYIRCKFIN